MTTTIAARSTWIAAPPIGTPSIPLAPPQIPLCLHPFIGDGLGLKRALAPPPSCVGPQPSSPSTFPLPPSTIYPLCPTFIHPRISVPLNPFLHSPFSPPPPPPATSCCADGKGQLTHTISKEHMGWVKGVAFDPLGRYLATQGRDGVKVWDVQRGWALVNHCKQPFEQAAEVGFRFR